YETFQSGLSVGDRYQDSIRTGNFDRNSSGSGWRQPVRTLTPFTVTASVRSNSFVNATVSVCQSGEEGSIDSIGSTGTVPVMASPSFGYGFVTPPGVGCAAL